MERARYKPLPTPDTVSDTKLLVEKVIQSRRRASMRHFSVQEAVAIEPVETEAPEATLPAEG